MISKKLQKLMQTKQVGLFKQAYRMPFSFTDVFKIINDISFQVEAKGEPYINYQSCALDQVFQVLNTEGHPFFKQYEKWLNDMKIFHYGFCEFDIVLSFKGVRGRAHVDRESVVILGLVNDTQYYFNNLDKVVTVSPGDILYIPHGTLHCASSHKERIVLSVGIYGNKR